MKLFIIARSNIRKNKNMTFTLMVLIVFAAILLYIGASVMMQMNTFLDQKNDELKGSDFTVLAPYQNEETIQTMVEKMDGYDQLEKEKAVAADARFKNITQKEKSQSVGCILLNADQKEDISKLKILDEGDQKQSNSIILPYYLKVAKGYKTGDEISIAYAGTKHSFVIYGFSEDIMFAIPSNVAYYKCYVFDEQFTKLYQEDDSTKFFLLKALMPKGTDTVKYSNTFIKEMNHKVTGSTSKISVLDYDSMKVGVSIFFIIIMSFLIMFSAIIILIALTVIRFAVVTYIEGNIQNIGSMEALGYTGHELVSSTVLQFALITLVSTIIGILIAFSCTGIVTNIVSSSIGLVWDNKINLSAIIINFVIILGSVIMISYMTASKIKKITPITALRSGIDTHNFRKNHLPLNRSKGNINMLMGFKTLMHNMKQNITVFIILTLMSFVCVFAFTANYNLIIDNTAMLRLVGLEKSDLMVSYIGKDSVQIFDQIGKLEDVSKTLRISRVEMTAYNGKNEITPAFYVCNDFSKVEINTIVKGRYPVQDNEIALTSLVLRQLGVKLGDTISVQGSSSKEEYIIVGMTQHINSLGKGGCMTEEGIKRISPEFVPSDLYIYLKDNKDVKTVSNKISEKYSNLPISMVNMEDQFDTLLESFNQAITAICIGCIVITLFIISLVLYLLIKIKLIKDRMRVGVSKALGYTTKQLILQVICSFFPVCMLGALLGTILATYLINPVLATLLSVGGSIDNCHFTINPMLDLVVFLSISVFSILITALVARAVRKITPCELFR